MTTIRLAYLNRWKSGSVIAHTSEHPAYPAEETQNESKQFFFRSRYGTGSGNGDFVVDTSNHHIDFDEGGSELNGTVASGTYSGATLATAIKTAMDAAAGSALTYTVTYDEATAKFTISSTSNFTIRWNTGTNKASDISGLCGYNDAANDTGASSYTSDYRRINSVVQIDVDLGSAIAVNFAAILNHNISASATEIKFYGADDSAFTTNVVSEAMTHATGNMFQFFSTSRTKRYWRLQIIDTSNSSSYIQVGPVFLTTYFEPNRNFTRGYQDGRDDFSEAQFTDSMVLSGIVRPRGQALLLPFESLTDSSKDSINDMLEEVGLIRPFIICLDYNAPNTNSYYVRNDAIEYPVNTGPSRWTWNATLKEAF